MTSVCVYVPSAGGGHARYAREFLTALTRHPGNAELYELVSSRDLKDEFRSDLYPVHTLLKPLRHRSEFSSSARWALSRLTHYHLRELQFVAWLKARPDVAAVHFQEWTPWLATGMVRRIKALGKKVFVTIHNVVPHRYPRFVPKSVVLDWDHAACRLCDGIFVHTDQLAQRMSELLGRPHPPIHVLPHGVWTVTDAGDGAGHDIPMEQRLAQRKLLFFGAIRRNKGLDLLLDAMNRLPGYSLTVAGEASEPDYFHNEIAPRIERLMAAGIEVDLRKGFTPEDQIGKLFNLHSAVVLPYTKEFVAQSGVVFMALAYGLPVIASEAGGLCDLFHEHAIGATFSEPTSEALATAIHHLCVDTDPRLLLHEICSARDDLSWDKAAAVAIAAYGMETERRMTKDDRELQTNFAH